MLSKLIVLCTLLAVATLQNPPVQIRSSASDISPDGDFQWSYESEDGSSQQQTGQQIPGPEGGQSVQGNAQWYDPEGQPHQLSYIADENGYQPNSADVPVGPEIPAAILRALQWNEAHPEEDNL